MVVEYSKHVSWVTVDRTVLDASCLFVASGCFEIVVG